MKFTPLTAEQRHQFEQDGFLIVRGALDAETVETLIAAGDRLCNSDRTENRQRPSAFYDGFRNCIAMDDAYLPLLTWHTTVPLVVQLLGPNLQLVTSHLIHKHADPPGTPRTHRDPGWHRDIAGTTEDLGHAHTPRMEMKIAYYLTDLSEPNSGSTLFLPGSQMLKESLHIPPGQSDPEGVVEPSLQPGDAVLFENRTWHSAAANLTGRTRKAVMFGYGYRWMKPFDYLTTPDSLASKLDDIGGQLLNCIKSPNGIFIPGGINKPLTDWCRAHGVEYRPPV